MGRARSPEDDEEQEGVDEQERCISSSFGHAALKPSSGGNQSTPRKRRSTQKAASPCPTEYGSPTSNSTGGSGSRFDRALGTLAKRFLALAEETPDGVLDLNKAADQLEVKKRRVYDITNVLEGVGLVEKKGKNHIKFLLLRDREDKDQHPEVERAKADVAALKEQEDALDASIEALSTALKALGEHPANHAKLFVTDEDITSLPCFADDVLFAVKAPAGTTLEVPPPEDLGNGQRHYKIVLRSTDGPVDVYLVQHPSNTAVEGSEAEGQPAAVEQQQQLPQQDHRRGSHATPHPSQDLQHLQQQQWQHVMGAGAAAGASGTAPAAAAATAALMQENKGFSQLSPRGMLQHAAQQQLPLPLQPTMPHLLQPDQGGAANAQLAGVLGGSGVISPLLPAALGSAFLPALGGIFNSPMLLSSPNMREVDPDLWYAEAGGTPGIPLQEFFKDEIPISLEDESIF